MLTNVLTFAVLGFMGVRLVSGLRTSRSAGGRSIVTQVVRNAGWRHVWPIPLVLGAVVAVAALLLMVPGLSWGWWSMLGGSGNPVFGSSDATSGTLWELVVPVVFIALLVPALPLFAYAEERIFRTGAEHWSRPRRAWKVLQFGLVHALIGVPIAAALAISLGGAYFLQVYLRSYGERRSRQAATIESTTAHTVYNAAVIALVVLAIVLDAALA
jgi:hypothetical protein